MAQLSFNRFAIFPEAVANETSRPGLLVLEPFQVTITIETNEGTVEVPTSLGSCIGLLPLCYLSSMSDPTDTYSLVTDGVITSGAITVNIKSEDIANGDVIIKGIFIGNMSDVVLLNTPSD